MLEGFIPWPEEDIRQFKAAGYWEDLTLGEHMDRWAEQYSDCPALAYQGIEVTYQQMANMPPVWRITCGNLG